MKQVVVRINKDDTYSREGAELLDFTTKVQYHYTFWSKEKLHLYRMPHHFSIGALDLFFISLTVFYCDRTEARYLQPDAWTRSFKIYMPVLEKEKWDSSKRLLEQALSFLTGDSWTFCFRERSLCEQEINANNGIDRYNKSNKLSSDLFCMLSGGLDSFIGASDLLSANQKPIFVGNYNGGKGVSIYQSKVIDLLTKQYLYDKDRFYQFYAAPIRGIEDTTRSRSFMFFSHAILMASTMKHKVKLVVPENGVISLNIPLTIHRAGSLSTRTTHPFWMSMLQQLITNLGLDVQLVNPYQFCTKGEMLLNCKDKRFVYDNIQWTMSCSHPDLGRYKGDNHPSHCGTCLPCTIRRAAILRAGIKDKSSYRDPKYSTGEGRNFLTSYKYGALLYKRNQIDPELAVLKSGQLDSEHINDYVGVYKRGMEELIELLNSL